MVGDEVANTLVGGKLERWKSRWKSGWKVEETKEEKRDFAKKITNKPWLNDMVKKDLKKWFRGLYNFFGQNCPWRYCCPIVWKSPHFFRVFLFFPTLCALPFFTFSLPVAHRHLCSWSIGRGPQLLRACGCLLFVVSSSMSPLLFPLHCSSSQPFFLATALRTSQLKKTPRELSYHFHHFLTVAKPFNLFVPNPSFSETTISLFSFHRFPGFPSQNLIYLSIYLFASLTALHFWKASFLFFFCIWVLDKFA